MTGNKANSTVKMAGTGFGGECVNYMQYKNEYILHSVMSTSTGKEVTVI
jgi:hypothetical protein